MHQGKIYIGTSGWSYKEWIGNFYPKDSKAPDLFPIYAQHFSTVELNSPFYHLPLKKTVEKWFTESPANFLFSVKASRYITHIKKLTEPTESVDKFLKVLEPLKEKTGPILFQLPPNFSCHPERLEELLKILPQEYKYTFELRNPDWFNEEIYQILKTYNTAFCIYDFDTRLSPRIVTADFVYIRFHGPKGKYVGSYSDAFLNEWSSIIREWQRMDKDVYCYFDNTADGSAIKNAQDLQLILCPSSQKSAEPCSP